MVSLTSKAPIDNAPAEQGFEVVAKNENGEISNKSQYEQSREERIRENLERMKKLGILDLSLKLKSLNKPTPKSTPSTRRTLEHSTPVPSSGPRRRSSRLQNATPVNYSEMPLKKKDNSWEDERDLLREEGAKPEVYTEEHEKLLGSTEMTWTLFVDGYGRDGKRIYDPVNGKTCHQCRQKTLGHRTHCCKCNKVQGQFCGDCLYMRYGEHVLEANQNPDWICPVCRGICNCSLCRQAKGWLPTGTLYKKITKLGFKSVAHYIIQTRRKNSDSEATPDSKVLLVKRSLPFSDIDATSMGNESSEFYPRPQGLEYDQSEGQVTADSGIGVGISEQEEKPHFLDNEKADCELKLEDNSEHIIQPAVSTNVNSNLHDCNNVVAMGTLVKKDIDDEKDEETTDCFAAPESNPISRGAEDESPDVEQQELSHAISSCTVETTANHLNSAASPIAATDLVSPSTVEAMPNPSHIATPTVTPPAAADSITRRLRPRRGTGNEHAEPMVLQQLNNVSFPLKAEATISGTTEPASNEAAAAPMTCSKSNKKRIRISEPSPDSIAGRLRQRRLEGGVI